MKRILIVDDEESLCTMVALRFLKRGYYVGCAYDGVSALTMVQAARPDVLVLDLGLPGMSGEEVCKRIREIEVECIELVPMKIVMLTAKGSEVDHIVGHVIGGDAYIDKPCDVEILIDEVEKLLG